MDSVDQILQGFWHHWDIKVLNFQIVSILNVLAVLFLAATAELYDFKVLFDIKSWQILDAFIFLGPIFAQAFSLIIVDSTTWLVNYDFGAANEMIIYWVALGLIAVIETAGNASSVLLVAVYALLAFLTLAATALSPILAISNPVFLALFVLAFLVIGLPLILDLAGFFLFGSFGVLSVSLVFDLFYLLFTEPELAIDTVEDVFAKGTASAIIKDFEDTLEDTLGVGFVHLFGLQTLQDILDQFWLHVTLQGLVVLPLTFLFTIGKAVLIVLGLVSAIFGFSLIGGDPIIGAPMLIGGIFTAIYILLVDGSAAAFLDLFVFSQLLPEADFAAFLFLDVMGRSLFNSFLSLEADYWGIFFLIDISDRFMNGSFTSPKEAIGGPPLPETKPAPELQPAPMPEVGMTVSEFISFLTPDHLENTDLEIVKQLTKPVVIGLLLPLVQVLTWAYQIPFLMDMRNHILGIGTEFFN